MFKRIFNSRDKKVGNKSENMLQIQNIFTLYHKEDEERRGRRRRRELEGKKEEVERLSLKSDFGNAG